MPLSPELATMRAPDLFARAEATSIYGEHRRWGISFQTDNTAGEMDNFSSPFQVPLDVVSAREVAHARPHRRGEFEAEDLLRLSFHGAGLRERGWPMLRYPTEAYAPRLSQGLPLPRSRISPSRPASSTTPSMPPRRKKNQALSGKKWTRPAIVSTRPMVAAWVTNTKCNIFHENPLKLDKAYKCAQDASRSCPRWVRDFGMHREELGLSNVSILWVWAIPTLLADDQMITPSAYDSQNSAKTFHKFRDGQLYRQPPSDFQPKKST
ncbi:hypothetical protein B0H14DRAFT_3699298 [Mycena olivaceomarginata]|nr:hypothetical protein B0H14DRAFT_3699298 [Mycena olivaceomarginata]